MARSENLVMSRQIRRKQVLLILLLKVAVFVGLNQERKMSAWPNLLVSVVSFSCLFFKNNMVVATSGLSLTKNNNFS